MTTRTAVPPEPPVGTWMKDRYGATTQRQVGGGWAPPGCMPFGVWTAMWEARGPYVECGPWGEELPAETALVDRVVAALEDIREARITGPEKEAVRVCIAKVKELLGGGE